ncbi:MAG: hypothetical protein IH944_04830 [Armatimonadetes bacterium]|nr:hypothetical protein [Armatimonadota bacterium]
MVGQLVIVAFLGASSLSPMQTSRQKLEDFGPKYYRTDDLSGVGGGPGITRIRSHLHEEERPKTSPLHGWQFPYLSEGFAKTAPGGEYALRFRVFNQFRPTENDPTDKVSRMLLRMWEFEYTRLEIDHALRFRAIDVYLCAGGEAGAEQLKIVDQQERDGFGNALRRSNIYIYQLMDPPGSFEFARELAHEYGHATLPTPAGFKEPESWPAGDLGERLFLSWFHRAMLDNKLKPSDCMDTDTFDLAKYLRDVAQPDIERVATEGPDLELLAKRTEAAYNEYLGLATYCAEIMPPKVFGRTLALTTTQDAEDYAIVVVEVAREPRRWDVTIPNYLKGKAIWLPLKVGKIHGAKVLRRKGAWAKVQPTSDSVYVTNPPLGDGSQP